MKTLTMLALFAANVFLASAAVAAEIDVRLSAREAYVGTPITLQVTIANASDYRQPEIPEVDGCSVRSAGAPSQSRQTTIINGRRSESRRVTMRYLVTPQREGTLEIPSFAIIVDGESMPTEPLRFVATTSVTGDLLFVEIEGGKKRVFVGEALELTLKIWLKPYRDAERRLTLSEGDMWKMISPQASWGRFADRMNQLDQSNQRPGGKEVLRKDEQGNDRAYYLYEISATDYPTRPGKIDADGVQIVVNYPTGLRQSGSPLGGFPGGTPFSRDPFGGNSILNRMMNDNFFGSSFGNRLSVASTRPIVGQVRVDATEVVPIPTDGRPNGYCGAVGRYRIATQVTPIVVDAGDPMTLNIGISGNGPMELVQAPLLSDLPSLTDDFKVPSQSLAGFVQKESKVFSTTIRPRREGVTRVPPIPFSFFDPETEKFETLMSEPIAITVNPSEMLALDAIVGSSIPRGDRSVPTAAIASGLPNFDNHDGASLLVSQTQSSPLPWWHWFVVAPPLIWCAAMIARYRNSISGLLARFQSPHQRCARAISQSRDGSDVVAALTQFIARRCGKRCETANDALGALRVSGRYELANRVEVFFRESQQSNIEQFSDPTLSQLREQALKLAENLSESFQTSTKSIVRLPKDHLPETSRSRVAQRSLGCLFAATIAFSTHSTISAEPTLPAKPNASDVRLTPPQQETILGEATSLYLRASDSVSSDSAEAKQLFDDAANRYQLLVDSGIRNSQLYINLGNAYLQNDELGKAIANYERARRLDPENRQLLVNLRFANSKVKRGDANAAATLDDRIFWGHIRSANNAVVQTIGLSAIIASVIVASLLFWGLLIVRTMGPRFAVWRWASAPLLLLLGSLGSYWLAWDEMNSGGNAVIVANEVRILAGDGERFATVVTFEEAQGHRVDIMTSRGEWTKIQTQQGQTGWVQSRDIERLR